MIDLIKALLVGFAVGGVFALAKSDPPAPASWAGLAGIVGIVLGWHLIVVALPIIKSWL